MNHIAEIFCAASAPPSSQFADEWIEQNFESIDGDIRGRVSFRWFKAQAFLLRAYQAERVRRITAMVATQCGKTWCAIFCLVWAVANRARTMAWYTDTNESAVLDYKTKLCPAFENCVTLEPFMPRKRENRSKNLIQFTSMNLFVLGANAQRNRERLTIPWILIDEARNLQPGALAEIEGRFKRYEASRQFKRFMFSTAGKVYYNEDGNPIGDELFSAYLRGSRHMLFWLCPHCAHRQTFRFGKPKSALYPKDREFGGFTWDTNDITMPREDEYNFEELAKTVRYECEKCRHRFIESDKWALFDSIDIKATNPLAPDDDISIHWWEAYMDSSVWANIVRKFLIAKVAMKRGDIAPMRVFVNDTLGEPWEEIIGDKLSESAILKRCGEYSVGEEWPSDMRRARVLTVDNQHGFIVFQYSLFNLAGQWRLVDCGPLASFDELRAYQLGKQILDPLVGIDVAYMPHDVNEACIRYGKWDAIKRGTDKEPERVWMGWTPLLGDDAEEFGQRLAGVAVRSPIAVKTVDINAGRGLPRLIQRVSWSKSHYRDALYSYALIGKTPFEIPKNILNYRRELLTQLSNVWKAPITDARGQVIGQEFVERGRHDYPDCYDSETEVLTETGWKYFKEWNGEAVATVKLQTNSLEFQKPTARIERHYAGEMIHISGRSTSCMVTPNHRMVVVNKYGKNPRFKSADAITIWDFLKPSCRWRGGKREPIKFKASHKMPAVELDRRLAAAFLGWYLSEGSMSDLHDKYGTRVVNVTQNRGEKWDRIHALLKQLPWTFTAFPSAENIFRGGNYQLCDWLEECGRGSGNKRIPEWLRESNAETCSSFLETAILGDGWMNDGHPTIATISKQLADGYSEMFLRTGFRASITTREPKPWKIAGNSGTNAQKQYHVSKLIGRRIHMRDGDSNSLIKRVQYDGMVYCLSVPNETLIVRRNGKMLVCGNCLTMGLALADWRNVRSAIQK